MTQTLEVVDLDAPPAPVRPPAWRSRLPWILFGVTLAALVLSLAPRTLPQPAPEPPAPPAEVSIETEAIGGVSPGPTVWRDEHGEIIVVMYPVSPYDFETVSCRLVVGDQEVTGEGVDGFPAVCVWARDAA